MAGADQVEHAQGLIVRRADPLNCETPMSLLRDGVVTAVQHFYIRNHFPVPSLHPDHWRLEVRGLVKKALTFRLQDLLNLPAQTMTVTIECAGNGRSSLDPKVDGEQWDLGAVSTAEWTGVPLTEILDRAAVGPGAREIVFGGADAVSDAPAGLPRRFERSLTLDDARSGRVLLAYAMNGGPLPPVHGYPLRVIVPGWYGVSGVKWLTDIEVVDRPFDGYFQTHRYVYEWERAGSVVREPVQRMRVRSLITHPSAGETVRPGDVAIRGLAWSGSAPIARVEVSINDGEWQTARLLGSTTQDCWHRWELITRVENSGKIRIRSRATDAGGNAQPDRAEWNRLGYGNNAIQEVAARLG